MIFEKNKRTVSYILIALSITLLAFAVWQLVEESVIGWVCLGLSMLFGVVLVIYNMFDLPTKDKAVEEVDLDMSLVRLPVKPRQITSITEDNPEELIREAEELLVDVSTFLDTHSATSTSNEINIKLLEFEKRLRTMLSLLNYMRVAPAIHREMKQRFEDVQERVQMIRYLNKRESEKCMKQTCDPDEILKTKSKKIFSFKS